MNSNFDEEQLKKLLKTLPKPNLDDRKFEDLVAECILRIPRYCPEWTNHNPGDPGITLIELFAWLTDQVLLRFNQVPLRNYITFLELLGISLDPPKAASVELTFYLSKEQNRRIIVEEGTEVATVRTETNPAIVFTTDRELAIAPPALRYLLLADDSTVPPNIAPLDNPLLPLYIGETLPNREQLGNWIEEVGEVALFPNFISGNCFYLVLDEKLAEGEKEREHPLRGHVLALTFKGQAATGTGIDPKHPPLRWEAWNGETWQDNILHHPQDDRTQGFSFRNAEELGINPIIEGADAILHLPQQWPKTNWGTRYTGHWLRCVYEIDEENYPNNRYRQSPQIRGIQVRAIGAAATASECVRVENELLGISDGKPGQCFQLQGNPILQCDRDKGEYIQIRLLDGTMEAWEEVPDFGDSGHESPHYLLNLQEGEVQFGPLIREPGRIQQQTRERIYRQPGGRLALRGSDHAATPALPPGEYENTALEWQYGKIPPRGSEIYMRTYRTGGGKRGNLQPQKLTILKSAIPYVKNVTNYREAMGGEDAQSLEQAIVGIPKLLRTRESAVTPEDFERIAMDCGGVARAHCARDRNESGTVLLLIVPNPNPLLNVDRLDFSKGMSPGTFALAEKHKTEILAYMSDRKPLGIQIRLETPKYVGIKVKAEIVLEAELLQELANLDPSGREQRRSQLKAQLCERLYRFLNPLVGGPEEKGWPRGRPVYASDIITWCQQTAGVRVGKLELFSIRLYDTWEVKETAETQIDLDRDGIFCSWSETHRESDRFGHEIYPID